MTYHEAIDYLFNVAPLFQNIGAGAYKEGLENTRTLDEHFGNPHRAYKTIHVAGTNGKGSVSHTLAAILQSAGYRVGLYTSPHLVDFRERIRVNGKMIPEERVIRFVEDERSFFEPLHPSFFELTTALAFQYFKEQEVDYAVIEVGLGGRLDCTNIITPLLSVITNISFDHTQFLGDTLEKIAREKAGIIKPGVPVVIGETRNNDTATEKHPEIRKVFFDKSLENKTSITFAEETDEIISWDGRTCETRHYGSFRTQLCGLCQEKNTRTILAAVEVITNYELRITKDEGGRREDELRITEEAIRNGFEHVCELTGLMGRWQKIQDSPTVICDTGHNPGGLRYIAEQLKALSLTLPHNEEGIHQGAGTPSPLRGEAGRKVFVVLGMVGDKDVRGSLSLFPKDATYYFTQASVKRAMPAREIAMLGKELRLKSASSNGRERFFPTVAEAYQAALHDAGPEDLIFVGGSSFIVADLLTFLQK